MNGQLMLLPWRFLIRLSSLRSFVYTWLCLLAVVAFGQACGGAKVRKVVAGAKVEQVNKIDKAEELFVLLSKDLEKMGQDDTIETEALRRRLQEILDLDNNHPGATFDLEALPKDGRPLGIQDKDTEKLAKRFPEFLPTQENVAAILGEAGDVMGAERLLLTLLEKNPLSTTARLSLARLLYASGRYLEAIEQCRNVLQRVPNAQEAFRVLAYAYHALGNIPMTRLVIERGLRGSAQDVELHQKLADLAAESEEVVATVAKLKEVIRYNPDKPSSRASLAEIAMNYRDFGTAAQQYEALLKLRPQLASAMLNLGVAYKGLGRYELAEKTYQEAAAANKSIAPEAIWNLSLLYRYHLNRYDDAIVALGKFSELVDQKDERIAQLPKLRAEIERVKNDLQAQEAKRLREEKRLAALQAACLAVSKGNPPEVEDLGSEQERIELAWQLMGTAQQQIGEGAVADGEANARCSFAILPDTPSANTGACAPIAVVWTQILYQLGRMDDAVKAISKGLQCDPNSPDAQLIDQQLKEIMAAQPPAG